MTREKAAGGKPKFLIIGGGIANFTDVSKTFAGIKMSLTEYKKKLQETDVKNKRNARPCAGFFF